MSKGITTPGRITLYKRIQMKCLDCSGGSSKEVTICHLFSCPLWARRLGVGPETKTYIQRMKTAEKFYEKDFERLKEQGIKLVDFYKEHPIVIFK